MKASRAFGLSGLQTLVKLGAGVVLAKSVAVAAGPAGFGVFAQFQAFVALATLVATSPLSVGLIKLSAQYRTTPERRASLYATAAWTAGVVALLGAMIMAAAASGFSQWTFRSAQYTPMIRFIGFANVFTVFNTMLVSILTGERDVPRVIVANIASTLVATAMAIAMLALCGIEGAMIGYVAGQALTLIITLGLIPRRVLGNFHSPIPRPAIDALRTLSSYAWVGLLPAISISMVEFLLRGTVAADQGWTAVGLWQGLARVSEAYLLVINSFLVIHLLPGLAAARDTSGLKRTLVESIRLVVPAALAMAAGIYLLRTFVFSVLFTTDFRIDANVVAWQLCGDLLRVFATVCGYLILAKSSPRTYAILELIFAAAYLAVGQFLISREGWQGAVHAFVIAHLLYLIAAVLVARRILQGITARSVFSQIPPR